MGRSAVSCDLKPRRGGSRRRPPRSQSAIGSAIAEQKAVDSSPAGRASSLPINRNGLAPAPEANRQPEQPHREKPEASEDDEVV